MRCKGRWFSNSTSCAHSSVINVSIFWLMWKADWPEIGLAHLGRATVVTRHTGVSAAWMPSAQKHIPSSLSELLGWWLQWEAEGWMNHFVSQPITIYIETYKLKYRRWVIQLGLKIASFLSHIPTLQNYDPYLRRIVFPPGPPVSVVPWLLREESEDSEHIIRLKPRSTCCHIACTAWPPALRLLKRRWPLCGSVQT